MKSRILVEPILVGREREIGELTRYLDSAVRGKGTTVFISGEAGSGKSRLAHEFLNLAKQKGVGVMAGWCLSDAAAPYFPFVEAFNTYFASFEQEEPVSLQKPGAPLSLSQIVSEEHGVTGWLTGPKAAEKPGKPQVISPQVWKDQVFAGVAKTLHVIAAQNPIILFIEDIHWADSASLALLHYIARAVNNSEKVLVLATLRSEELTADAEGRPHPLTDVLRMMRREDLFMEIKLSNLNQASVSRIAENMIGGFLEAKFAEKLAAESRGNPLFIVESLRMLSERKNLIEENNEWRLAVDEFGVPSKIKDIILRRLSVLKYAQRRVLDAASVIGEKFDVELLSSVLGQDSLEVLEILNVVAHSTSLVGVEGSFYRFDHARSRETLYEELALPLKKGYHGRVAEKLENTKDAVLPLSDLAFHYAQAGDKEKAVKYAFAAGKDELAKYSNMQAIKHFQYVLQNVADGQDEKKLIAFEGLGDAYYASCIYGEAIKTFDELATSVTGAAKLRAIRKAMDAAYTQADKPDLLLEYAKKAQELAIYDRLEMARVLCNRAKAFGWAGRGDFKQDLADYNSALCVFEQENSLYDVADALWRSGIVSTFLADCRQKGIGNVLRSIAIFNELGDSRKEVEATLWAGGALANAGLRLEGESKFVKVIEIGEKLGAFVELAQACSGLSRRYTNVAMELIAFQGGPLSAPTRENLDKALALGLKGLEYCKKTDANWIQLALCGEVSRIYSILGELKLAEEYLLKASEPSTMPYQFIVFLEVIGARGAFLAAKGQFNESIKVTEEMLKFLEIYKLQSVEGEIRLLYATELQKLGFGEEAEVQFDKGQKLLCSFKEQVEANFGHTYVQLSLLLPRKVAVDEEFEMRVDLVNASREQGFLQKLEGIILSEINCVYFPSFCSLHGSGIVLNDKKIGPFEVVTIKLKLKASKPGIYRLNPKLSYADELGKTKTCDSEPIDLTVEVAKQSFEVLAGRVATGTFDLDRVLIGGIPEKYAVALIASSIEGRQELVEHYIEVGLKNGETTFYLTNELGITAVWAEKYSLCMFLFVCNSRSELIAKDLPNVYKLKGVDSLTGIDIALAKAFRQVDSSNVKPKRACIEIVSDVLLQHHAVTTRKWLSGAIQELKFRGFTILAVIDPSMHPSEELQAVLGLFDGEISIYEKETGKGSARFLKVKRLSNQKYSKDEAIFT